MRKKKTGDISKLFEIDGRITTDPVIISNAFNEQYASTGSRLAKKFPDTGTYDKYCRTSNSYFSLRKVQPKNVRKIIESLEPKTSHGHDLLTNKILKKNAFSFVFPLTYLINTSIQHNYYPLCWKITRIFPIFKGGDSLNTLSYRPVSLSPVSSKILEKVINAQVTKYLEKENLLPTNQYGFRAKNRTSHLLFCFLKKVIEALESKKKVLCTFVDLSKAFDTLPHQAILDKIGHLGFSRDTIDWFRSYLKDRFQYCEFNGILSGYLAVEYGTPQGTCLGPTIFLMYTIDIQYATKHSYIFSFADDTSLITIGDSVEEVERKANEDYCSLTDYYKCSKLTLNLGKTKYMLFGATENLNLTIQGGNIQRTCEYKLVGLILDEKLSFQAHCQETARKTRLIYVMLSKAKYDLSEKAKNTVYNSLFRPYMHQLIEHFGAAAEKYLKPIKILQKKTLRIVYNLPYNASTMTICREKQILRLEDEIILSRIQLAKSIADVNAPQNIKELIPLKKEVTTITRSEGKTMFEIKTPKTNLGLKNSPFNVPYLWNNLHVTAQELNSKSLAKHVKRQLTSLYI